MKKTMTKRYYKTSSAVNYPNLATIYSEAIAQAKQDLIDHKDKEEIYIVEIVAVVKRAQSPIIVEEIRRER